MNVGLTTPEVERARRWVAQRLGLEYSANRGLDLARGVEAAMSELGLQSFAAFEALLEASSPDSVPSSVTDVLAKHLTIGETYFFRDQAVFAALDQAILPALIGRESPRRELRIWSAGCCTGEEPYSIAIAVDRALRDPERWEISILGTDVNPVFLRRAELAVFNAWSFRNVAPELRARYFTEREGQHFELDVKIRQMVRFARLNLVHDAYPSAMTGTQELDLIFCRNVLMYLGAEVVQKVVERFRRCLRDGGFLVVSPTETSVELFRQFESKFLRGAIVYQRRDARLDPKLELRLPDRSAGTRPSAATRAMDDAKVSPGSRSGPRPSCDRASERVPVPARAALPSARPSEADPPISGEPPSLFTQARQAANSGNLKQALELCERALGGSKLDCSLHYLRGSILAELGRSNEAVQALERALYLDPDFVLAHFSLGHLAFQRGQLRTARRYLGNVLTLTREMDPDQELAEAGGLRAARLAQIAESLLGML
ncbi:MAG TPA: CheR family methyltransferase [Polyangiaceae bacterium]|nr:CheR family methyltransferase [Polyangiaceae bacterium]